MSIPANEFLFICEKDEMILCINFMVFTHSLIRNYNLLTYKKKTFVRIANVRSLTCYYNLHLIGHNRVLRQEFS